MEKSNAQENYNDYVSTTLRELLKSSPKTGKKTTYKTLAEYLNVKQQSVSSWCNGTTIPDTKHIKPIAEYFGVSCDYLLGRARTHAPDDLIEAVCEMLCMSELSLHNYKCFANEARHYDRPNKFNPFENVIKGLNYLLESGEGWVALNLVGALFYPQKSRIELQTSEPEEMDFAKITFTDKCLAALTKVLAQEKARQEKGENTAHKQMYIEYGEKRNPSHKSIIYGGVDNGTDEN